MRSARSGAPGRAPTARSIGAPAGISAVNPTTQEITWWSPTLNSAVTATGTGTITLPYASNMFPPNSTGTSDSAAFETATFSGTFTLTSAEPVTFQLGSDDDSFIYVDGILIGQNPGVHAISNVNFTSGTLAMGTHTLNVFYADREQVAAYLSLSLVTQGVVTNPVPEPSTWTLLAAGLLLTLGVGSRHRARPSPRRSGPGATY